MLVNVRLGADAVKPKVMSTVESSEGEDEDEEMTEEDKGEMDINCVLDL